MSTAHAIYCQDCNRANYPTEYDLNQEQINALIKTAPSFIKLLEVQEELNNYPFMFEFEVMFEYDHLSWNTIHFLKEHYQHQVTCLTEYEINDLPEWPWPKDQQTQEAEELYQALPTEGKKKANWFLLACWQERKDRETC